MTDDLLWHRIQFALSVTYPGLLLIYGGPACFPAFDFHRKLHERGSTIPPSVESDEYGKE